MFLIQEMVIHCDVPEKATCGKTLDGGACDVVSKLSRLM